jgi:hypothetical protein
MAKELVPLDISNIPELVRIAEEVRDTNSPRVLKRDSEDLAVLVPVRARRRRVGRTPIKSDHEAFLSAAGSWKDADVDKFLADNNASRKGSSRPPVDL